MRKGKKLLLCLAGAMSVTAVYISTALGAENPSSHSLAILDRGGIITQNGSLTIPYTLMNLSWEEKDVCAVTAAYESDGTLSNVKMDNLILPPAQAQQGVFSVDTADPDKEIKTFFLKGMDTLEPLCEPLLWQAEQGERTAIRIEGEQYSRELSTATLNTASESTRSGGTFAHLTVSQYTSGEHYKIVYSVQCDTAGIYNLSMVTSNLWSGYSAGYSVCVNGRAELACSDAEETQSKLPVSNTNYNGIFSEYSFGRYALNKGENTVTISVERKNWLSGGCTFYIDYLEFQPVAAGSGSFTLRAQDAPLNVFEESGGVKFSVIPDAPFAENETLHYAFTDYFGKVTEGDVTLTALAPFAGITEQLPIGWYKLTVSGKGGSETHALAVVPDTAERDSTVYNPFAIDLVSAQQDSLEATSHPGTTALQYGKYFYNQRGYARSAVLAGADWVRERMLWRQAMGSETASYNFTTLRGASDQLRRAGLNIINCFAEAPSWERRTSAASNSLPKDPRAVYDFVSKAIEDAGEYVDVWEIWNEQDAMQFARESADWYGAMLKAAAIAAANSEQKPYVTFGGLSSSLASSAAQAEYNHLMLQNDVMDYADIYNYHTHKTYRTAADLLTPRTEIIEAHKLASSLYNGGDKPVWVTESGLRLMLPSGRTAMTAAEEKLQARYFPRAFLEEIANGADRQFLFLGMPFLEWSDTSAADFGIFDAQNEPRPSYAVQAVMSKLLEGTSYLGEVHSLPSNAKGYAMQKGSSVIEVLWADSNTQAVIPAAGTVTKYDLMGQQSSVQSSGGNITVTLSPDPIYLIFGSRSNASNYYPRPRGFREPQKRELTDAEKLVLIAEFPVREDASDRETGYSLSMSEDNKVAVSVYNFSDKEMKGTLRAIPEGDAFNVTVPEDEISIAAGEAGIVTLTLTSDDATVFGATYDLKITGDFAASGESAEKLSAYVAKVRFDRGAEKVEDYVLREGSQTVSRWGLENRPAGVSVKASAADSGGVRFDLSSSVDGQVYFYPYTYSRTQSLASFDGIRFSIYFDEDVVNNAADFVSVQIWRQGGTNSDKFITPNGRIPIKKGWNDYAFTWDQIVQFTNSSVSMASQNLSELRYVSVGVVTTRSQLSYTIKNVGFFKTTAQKAVLPEFTNVSTQRSANSITLSAAVPAEVEPEGVRILYDGEECDFILNGRELNLSVPDPNEGPHELLLIAYTATGRAIYRQISI